MADSAERKTRKLAAAIASLEEQLATLRETAVSLKYQIDWFKRQLLGQRFNGLPGPGRRSTGRSAAGRARDGWESSHAGYRRTARHRGAGGGRAWTHDGAAGAERA